MSTCIAERKHKYIIANNLLHSDLFLLPTSLKSDATDTVHYFCIINMRFLRKVMDGAFEYKLVFC